MNVLMLGWGKGSWEIRGHQLGAALGARIRFDPTPEDWAWADVAYVVKRCEPRYGPAARLKGVPLVWDALDCWRQPNENADSPEAARQRLKNHLAVIQPALAIGATRAQAEALGGVYLPHHSRPGLTPRPVRDRVSCVAYEGNAAYLGAWLEVLSKACGVRGWKFSVNPPDLSEADLVVALRDGCWDGYPCREWKSGVKLVNAVACGRPVLTQTTAAAREILPPGSIVETPEEVKAALDYWADADRRRDAANVCGILASAYTVEALAGQATRILEALPCRT